MKNVLNVRGNLLLINLVVIGLILWLAVSFLFIAAAQRSEAALLHDAIGNDRTMSRAGRALATERRLFVEILGFDAHASASAMAPLRSAMDHADAILEEMTAQVVRLCNEAGFVAKIPASRSHVEQQLARLEENRTELQALREAVLGKRASSRAVRDPAVFARLMDEQTRVQERLATLARSLKYLPDFDAASIAIYHTLLAEILMLNVDLASKDATLFAGIAPGADVASDARIRLAVLGERIGHRLESMASLAQASDDAGRLHAAALAVQDFYHEKGGAIERVVGGADPSTEKGYGLRASWLEVTAERNRLVDRLESAAFASIERLARRSADRATRNYAIDLFLVVLCFVITAASVAVNRKVKRHAYHDGLTGLANRMNFESALNHTTGSAAQSHAVVFLDLDRFKSINDNYGHATGDDLLVEVAVRLRRVCKSTDLLARLGGDEFAVLLRDVESGAAAEVAAHRMVGAVEQVFGIRGLNLSVSASAGISVAPEDCRGGVALLRNADVAMYHVKSRASGRVFRFNQDIAADYDDRLQLEQDLRRSLEKGNFHLVYQPKVCTRTGQVRSVEALLRWTHATRGLVSPAQFIPVAEENGLMGGIGQWVLDEACREIAELNRGDLPNLQVAVNVSGQQFGDEHFVDQVCAAVDAHGLSYSNLSLEVTESIVMNDVERVILMLKALRDLDIGIAVDDFGTGYSSLQYLQELPLDTLKIDRAFIEALDQHAPQSSVANLIVQLATLFGLETVAEGVETPEQETKIKSLGVHHIQGYLYSRPVPAAELPAVIRAIGERGGSADPRATIRAA